MFFFFSNEEGTHNTAQIAIKIHKKETYWITQVKATHNLFLLNLIGISTAYQMLLKLADYDIDIMNDHFSLYNNKEKIPFSTLRTYFENSLDISDEKLSLIEYINQTITPLYYNGQFTYLGQLLTDFENGIHFKKILEQKGYDGYIFSESIGTNTIIKRS